MRHTLFPKINPGRLCLWLGVLATGVLQASSDLATFDDLSRWSQPKVTGVSFAQEPEVTRFALEADVATSGRRSFELKLNTWVPLTEDAVNAGMWVYVAKNPGLASTWLTFVDAKGRAFEYTLPGMESWQTGWQYLETFAFDANEMGKLHPQVGRLLGDPDGAGNLPVRPLSLTGLRFEADSKVAGEWLLKSVTADAHTLGSAGYHWALNIPGLRYNMTQTWTQSDVQPWLMAGQLLPDGGDAIVSWEVRAGFQGVPMLRGEHRLTFVADDYRAKAERIGLGSLPRGDYELVVTKRPADPRQVIPDGWRRLIWHAEGQTFWDGGSDGSASVLTGKKTGGESQGIVGWRQIMPLKGEAGDYELSFIGSGSGKPVARLVAINKAHQQVGETLIIPLPSNHGTGRIARTVTLPAEIDKVQLDLIATQPGDAAFHSISLKKNGVEYVINGEAVVADQIKQETWNLAVLSSPDAGRLSPPPAATVPVGKALVVPAPSWADLPGDKHWRVTATDGSEAGSGVVEVGTEINWVPPAEGVYSYVAERRQGGLLVDRDTRLLGGRTDPSELGPSTFVNREKAPTEADLFGPGKNYFTWAMYENHPEAPAFFKDTLQWIKDGRAAGFDLIRIRADWDKIEQLPGVYDFSVVDRLIEMVKSQGGRVILELRFEAPGWLPVEHQLNNYGRADVWRHGRVGRIPSVWTPGMLDSIRAYTEAAVRHYRNLDCIAGYHVWGLPGSLDWTTIDKPYWGQRADYSPVAVAAFDQWTNGRYAGTPPMASADWSRPDLSQGWRDWMDFRRHGLDTFFIDSVLRPIRELDDRRSIVGYFGLDYWSERLTDSARTLHWRRHTGGVELYYQIPLQARRAVVETGMAWPHEVHLLTPVPAGLEEATFQLSSVGGEGYHWNFYWRNNYPVGTWTENRESGLAEWQSIWEPLWHEMRDAKLAQQPDLAAVHTWSTMQYGLRSFFPLRMADYITRPAASMYRDHLSPDWFSDNAASLDLSHYRLIVVPPVGAQVMPVRMADALADYVSKGGNIAVFPDSGRWILENANEDNGLWKRLGWNPVGNREARLGEGQSSEVGNSGLPLNANQDPVEAVKPQAGGAWFAETQPLFLRKSSDWRLGTAGSHRVEACFEDGSPAVISWQHGRGHVVAFAGQPDWAKSPGVFASLYRASGGVIGAYADRPDVEITHLVKDNVHYAVMHRLPDSLRPHLAMPIPDLDRAALRKMTPAIETAWHLKGMPAGVHWRVTELTGLSEGQDGGVKSTEELISGVPVRLYLSQTLVYKLEPVTSVK
jgi:hypothetical protein